MEKAVVVTMLSLVCFGCSGTSGPEELDDSQDAAVEEAVGEEIPAADFEAGVKEVEAQVDIVQEVPDVSGQEVPSLECNPGEGCFMDKCDENIDCQSGWCVQHMGEGVCSKLCQEECPDGWTCKQAGGGPDLVYVCVSDYTNLCRPCSSGNDCKTTTGAEDVCVNYGADGKFCGGPCGDEDECPWGFSCQESETVEGVLLFQCVADAGVCPCTDSSVALGLWTPCHVANEWGICEGKRVCSEEGLSDCDALLPAQEECNGIDDDCDGEIDEPNLVGGDYINVCDDGNDCTDDVCNGPEGCLNKVMESGSCDDGNPCTVADHCELAVCIGDPVECDDENPCTDNLCTETGGCEYPPNSDPCDDGDPCTLADQCVDAECVGTDIPCDCQADPDCAELEDGDLCNGTLVCDVSALPHKCVVDPATLLTCPEPQGPGSDCLHAACNPETGQCSIEPGNEGQFCDDSNACTLGEKCTQGECSEGGQANCSDDNLCTEDFCDPESGCVHVNNTISCQDGDACTIGDLCQDGECVPGAEKECNDGNSCTQDSCNPMSGCQHEFLTEECDDGNSCTTGDKCVNGVCTGMALVDCDDDNPCTKDLCTPGGGCSNIAVAGPCDDGDACTIGDYCQNGVCASGLDKPCDDGNECTENSCFNGACLFAPVDGDCDDENKCTLIDQCINGKCLGGDPPDCDDQNLCTSELCDPAAGCVYTVNELLCDDDNLCTTNDTCVNGNCEGTDLLICDDNNECTLDNCSPDSGCFFAPWDGNCDDGNPCTVNDACVEGSCIGQAFLDCNDGNPCTADSCDFVAGACINLPVDGFCSDDNACTINDYCELGQCAGGPALNCNDANACTDDSCDSNAGCVYEFNTAPCSDGDVCTTGDKCGNGQCQPGDAELNCNDGNVCTDDSCEPGLGCKHVVNNESCDDGNMCTQNDSCEEGICQPGDALQCPDDGDACTQELCDPNQGCLHPPIVPCCGNGQVEQGEECDDGNTQNNDGCDSNCQDEAQCVDSGNDKLIYVAELNACLQALGAQFSAVQYIEVAYGHTDYLDNICQAMGYQAYNGCHGGDKCNSSAKMYPSYCNQGWLGGPCHNGCGNVNYDGFFCK